MKATILSLLFLLTVVCNSYAASKTEEYELMEKCGKRAEEYFRHHCGTGLNGNESYQFTNHYNAKLNKCFILLSNSKIEENNTDLLKELIDINDNNTYGSVFLYHIFDPSPKVWACKVLNKDCHSEAEWSELVKPYMNE